MNNLLIKILQDIFGELKKPEIYDKIEVLYVNEKKYIMKGWKEKNSYYVYCENLNRVTIEENEKKAFENMIKYIINTVIWKK
ncbi:MAG: hypothetical protein QW117_02950 [Candidatus Pacearchaeota archaeon]